MKLSILHFITELMFKSFLMIKTSSSREKQVECAKFLRLKFCTKDFRLSKLEILINFFYRFRSTFRNNVARTAVSATLTVFTRCHNTRSRRSEKLRRVVVVTIVNNKVSVDKPNPSSERR